MFTANHFVRPFPKRIVLRWGRQSSRASSSEAQSKNKYKVLIVGAGSGGLSVAHQIYDRFKAAGQTLNKADIAIVDAADYHYYQPGWTLVGAGLCPKSDFRRPLSSLIPEYLQHIPEYVSTFNPTQSRVTTASGREISYDNLVVAAGLQINWNKIQGLPNALADPNSGVSSIYSASSCDKVWEDLEGLRSGTIIFTQPTGVIKCAGAPQKIMWMAWDRYRKTGRRDNIKIDFYNGMPTMFSVKKYSDALEVLRKERNIGGYFQHNLVAIDAPNHKATFQKADGTLLEVDYTVLHAVPPMGPLDFLRGSPISDNAGWVAVDPGTLQHNNPQFSNIFALGDCSSLPTSKTAAAITAQAPILTENLYSFMTTGKVGNARYDGYTSCPLLTGYGELMLAEFKYGLEPKESFASFVDQSKSRRVFYHFSKDLFPAAYWQFMVRGRWYGVSGLVRPQF